MTNCLVTGGAGFIGSNLVAALLERDHAVRVLDNFSTGKRENVTPFLDRIDLIEGDLTYMADVERAVQDIDVVFHQAAIPSVPRSVSDPLACHEANTTGTLNILIAARDAKVRRLVYASSSSVYGDQNTAKAKVETMAPQPISPYGAAKLSAEHYCQVFYTVYGLETVALRYFNVFGPRQDPASMYAAVIPRFITALLRGEPPTIYGDGEQTRDFTYVGNVVTGNLLAAEAPADRAAGRVFNVAAGQQMSLNELVRLLQDLTGQAVEPVYTAPRPGDIRHSLADISKARHMLGYEPNVSFLEGLRQTVDWYRDRHG